MAASIEWPYTYATGTSNQTITFPHFTNLSPLTMADFDAADDGTQAMKEAVMAAKIDALEQRIKELEERLK